MNAYKRSIKNINDLSKSPYWAVDTRMLSSNKIAN